MNEILNAVLKIIIILVSTVLAVAFAFIVVVLPILFSTIKSQKRFYTEKKEGIFRMRIPGFVFWMGVIVTVAFLIPAAICLVQKESIYIILILMVFALLGAYLSIYVYRWEIIVDGAIFRIYSLFHRVKEIQLSEITSVKQKEGGMIGYIAEKRIFNVDKYVPGYDLFHAMLYKAGKMETTQKKYHFYVLQHRGNIVVAIIGALFFGGLFVYAVLWPDDSVNSFVYIASFGIFAACIGLMIYSLVWKLEINEDKLLIRNGLGFMKTFLISKITKVKIKNDYLYIHIGKEKAAKVQIHSVNMPILLERLKSENIPGLE